MNYAERKSVFEQALTEYEPRCRELAAWMGEHPEISRQEKETSARIVSLLREEGFSVETDLADLPYSFRAVKLPEGKAFSHRMAILTEYDALPGLGHACGHNLSCAVSLLAGLALNGLQEDLDTEIHVVGTPREEVIEGKVALRKNFHGIGLIQRTDSDGYATFSAVIKQSGCTVIFR